MHLNRNIKFVFSIPLILFIAACSTGKETNKDGSSSEKIVWTNELSLDVAREFVDRLDITDSKSRPVFMVGKIETAGADPVICAGLENDIELALVNTGKVSFIDDKKQLENERNYRKSMSDFQTTDEINEYMNKFNVDYFIEGRVKKTDNGIETSFLISLRSFNINTGESIEWQKVVSK